MRLAIVGTRVVGDEVDQAIARRHIAKEIFKHRPDLVISGGAEGIDSMAAEMARLFGYQMIEHLPKNPQWEPNGYKARNVLIAVSCDELICIRHRQSTSRGSAWTADYAKEIGKPVTTITFGEPA